MKLYKMPDRYITYRPDGFTVHTPIMPYHTNYKFDAIDYKWVVCRTGDESLLVAKRLELYCEIVYYLKRPLKFISDLRERWEGRKK